jgi:hypothetical protein
MEWPALAALAASVSSLAAVAGMYVNTRREFVMRTERGQQTRAVADQALAMASIAQAHTKLLEERLTEHRVEVAGQYVTNKDLAETERRITHAIDKLCARFDRHFQTRE